MFAKTETISNKHIHLNFFSPMFDDVSAVLLNSFLEKLAKLFFSSPALTSAISLMLDFTSVFVSS
ncbi:hypothetical protein EDP2_2515 [Enterobacter cloacae S611]|uniref:Uncharacterized protein n=1 Tax=Enterobacter cloacae S611 TaxID=1399146 RepID=A0ABP2ZNL7_ENTCL|nr:hypothetical protein EDP2_2515 [Enterobacter cloacae S611]